MSNQNNNRREFLRTLLAGGASGALGSLGQLALMSEASAATPAFSDYKAMVCVYMYGGNDSFNMLIPTGADALTGYGAYANSRGGLAVANRSLNTGGANVSSGTGNPYYSNGSAAQAYLKGYYPLAGSKGFELGVNAVMPELANLIYGNKASVVANVGNLVEPVSKAQIQAETANLPLFLFAHNHQQRALQTGQGNNLNDVGWAGRIADNWLGVNSGSPMGLNISYAGSDRMMIGNTASPLAVTHGNPPQIYDMQKAMYDTHTDRRSLFQAMHGIQNTSSSGYISFDASKTYTSANPFERLFSATSKKSTQVFDLLKDSWDGHTVNYAKKDSYGNDLFSVPSPPELGFEDGVKGDFIAQLEAVAKMVDMGVRDSFSSGGYNRQIFMVSLGSFDTHSDQALKHPLLLRELSLGLSKFQTAMEELGHANKVSTFTMSDFGRTLGNNGDGTDHAWGAHHLVMGGDGLSQSGNLSGGRMLGSLPDFNLGGLNDYNDQGRIIPTTAQDQLNGSLCRWFGVDDALMPSIFPNLANFGQAPGSISSAYLDELFVI
jgi:uncharacterized protein (DUF1501 family)